MSNSPDFCGQTPSLKLLMFFFCNNFRLTKIVEIFHILFTPMFTFYYICFISLSPYTRTHTHTHVHTCAHMCAHMHTRMHARTHMHTRAHTCTDAHIHIFILNLLNVSWGYDALCLQVLHQVLKTGQSHNIIIKIRNVILTSHYAIYRQSNFIISHQWLWS